MRQFRKGQCWSKQTRQATKEECTSPDGISFDSMAEMRRWCKLKLLESQGAISQLERQVKIPLLLPNGRHVLTAKGISTRTGKPIGGRPMHYLLDFRYLDVRGYMHGTAGALIHEEFKGYPTPEAKLKMSVVEAIYGIEIKIVKKP